jgi:hypothetical protein
VEDRVVNAIHLEAQPGIADESSAEKLLAVV